MVKVNVSEVSVINLADYVRFKKTVCCKYNKSIEGCGECPLSIENNGKCEPCLDFVVYYPKEASEMIERWCEKHPVKTRLTEFLKMFPDAKLNCDGFPIHCIEHYCGSCVSSCNCCNCRECKAKYWNQEIKD